MKKRRIYISGPMSGLPRKEYLLNFAATHVMLEACGYEVVSPTQLAPCRWPWLYRLLGYRLTLAYDIYHLRRCTHIYMMPGSEHSKGARLERLTARRLNIQLLP